MKNIKKVASVRKRRNVKKEALMSLIDYKKALEFWSDPCWQEPPGPLG